MNDLRKVLLLLDAKLKIRFIILIFLIIHTYKDLSSSVEEWYFHSTYIYLIVMIIASLYFIFRWKKININTFKNLPTE